MKKYLPFITIIFISFFLIVYLTVQGYQKNGKVRLLPVLGDSEINGTDTAFHTTLDFHFVNQLGDTITEKDVENKNFVVEYFFTTCQSICPIMNKNMMLVAKEFENDSEFKILSHTVIPEEDSIPVLLEYANDHKANHKNWWFLTGDKKHLYEIARKSYLMNADEGNGDKDDFIHTQLFVLIDKDRHIRGSYDGTVKADVELLISDIHKLKEEQAQNKK